MPEVLADLQEEGHLAGDLQPLNLWYNGLVQVAVKNCKKLLLKCTAWEEDFAEALLEFWKFPWSNGYSPTQLMYVWLAHEDGSPDSCRGVRAGSHRGGEGGEEENTRHSIGGNRKPPSGNFL